MKKKFISFTKIMPIGFLREATLTRPIRYTEVIGLYNVLAVDNLSLFLNSTIYFNEQQQDVFDAEREIMSAGFEFLGVMPLLSSMVNLTSNTCVKILDEIDAICVYREMLNLEPIPPRFYANKFNNTVPKLHENIKDEKEKTQDEW